MTEIYLIDDVVYSMYSADLVVLGNVYFNILQLIASIPIQLWLNIPP